MPRDIKRESFVDVLNAVVHQKLPLSRMYHFECFVRISLKRLKPQTNPTRCEENLLNIKYHWVCFVFPNRTKKRQKKIICHNFFFIQQPSRHIGNFLVFFMLLLSSLYDSVTIYLKGLKAKQENKFEKYEILW